MTSHRLPCFPSQFRWTEQLFLFEPFNCYETVALDWIHPANLEPDIEESCIPVDVLGCNPTHLLVPSLNQGMKAVDVVEMIDPVVVLVGRDHLAVASMSRTFQAWCPGRNRI